MKRGRVTNLNIDNINVKVGEKVWICATEFKTEFKKYENNKDGTILGNIKDEFFNQYILDKKKNVVDWEDKWFTKFSFTEVVINEIYVGGNAEPHIYFEPFYDKETDKEIDFALRYPYQLYFKINDDYVRIFKYNKSL